MSDKATILAILRETHYDGMTTVSLDEMAERLAALTPPATPADREGMVLDDVRNAARIFKQAILAALGVTDPWAITVENQATICKRIAALRSPEAREGQGVRLSDVENAVRRQAALWLYHRQTDDPFGVSWERKRPEYEYEVEGLVTMAMAQLRASPAHPPVAEVTRDMVDRAMKATWSAAFPDIQWGDGHPRIESEYRARITAILTAAITEARNG